MGFFGELVKLSDAKCIAPALESLIVGGDILEIARDIVDDFAIDFIVCADFDAFKIIQNIEFHEGKACAAVDSAGVFQSYSIKPATASFPPCGGAKFMSLLCDKLANLPTFFCGEGTIAYACAVGFGDANDFFDCIWSDATSAASPRRDGARASDKRICLLYTSDAADDCWSV